MCNGLKGIYIWEAKVTENKSLLPDFSYFHASIEAVIGEETSYSWDSTA